MMEGISGADGVASHGMAGRVRAVKAGPVGAGPVVSCLVRSGRGSRVTSGPVASRCVLSSRVRVKEVPVLPVHHRGTGLK